MNTIGKILLESRKSKGITQEELAESSKVNLRTIQRIENCENLPRGKTLKLICEALEIDHLMLLDILKSTERKPIAEDLINLFFLVLINLVIVFIIGYLFIDSEANLNSRVGGFILSFFLAFFILHFTQSQTKVERFLKFGTGVLIYLIVLTLLHGFPIVFLSGLFTAIMIYLVFLLYGDKLIKKPA